MIRHLYLHIPFCPNKCSYCAFVTHVGSLKLIPAYFEALKTDIADRALERPAGPLSTVHFGGGTPNMLEQWQVCEVLYQVDRSVGRETGCAVTLEAHPDTVDEGLLADFRMAGVTRISFGGESLQPGELLALGRSHSAERLTEVVAMSRAAGFSSVALDFMYGLPGQCLVSWRKTLDAAIRLAPDHLSLYPLSIEPRTVFARRQRRHDLDLPADDDVVAMYRLACDELSAAGYLHYEVSNWAQPGHECRHNFAYWQNEEYHAAGVGAHSYLKPHRVENLAQTRRYIETVSRGASPAARRELVDGATEMVEAIMLRLRLLADGIVLTDFRSEYGVDLLVRYRRDLEDLSRAGLILVEDDRLRLTEDAVPVANEVWARFM